ncbi:MAG: hypothetical protein ABSD88_00465 [Candidatus Korobacteraceae bacterium]
MQKVQPVTEAEVIAEYLKNEFYQPEFHKDRETFEDLVLNPDLNDSKQNALRHMLLLRRRQDVWHDLPRDTQWWEVRVESADLDLIRVASRPEWTRLANGSMLIKDVAERIRSGRFDGNSIRKVQDMAYCLRQSVHRSSVVLIGVDEGKPLTILEGNHKLLATVVVSHEPASWRLRVIAGFSARMDECCCYEPRLSNRWRLFKSRLTNRNIPGKPVLDLGRIQQT